jgi:NAD(P)-dependent dehydrogenase (short-subunit alcohol dehydrogenase family)
MTAVSNVMPYVASKRAVVGITRSFEVDHGRYGIRINAVCPGIVETPMFAQRQEIEGKFNGENSKQSTVGEPPLVNIS